MIYDNTYIEKKEFLFMVILWWKNVKKWRSLVKMKYHSTIKMEKIRVDIKIEWYSYGNKNINYQNALPFYDYHTGTTKYF